MLDLNERNIYRKIKIYTTIDDLSSEENQFNNKPLKESNNISNYKQTVSFDTVPKFLGYSQNDLNPNETSNELDLDYVTSDTLTDNSDYFNYKYSQDRSKSPPPKKAIDKFSPNGASPSFPIIQKKKSLNDIFKIGHNGKLVRIDYPTRPSIESYAIIINKYQLHWLKMWNRRKKIIESRYFNKNKYFLKPDILFDAGENKNTSRSTKGSSTMMYSMDLTKRQRKLKTLRIQENDDVYNKMSTQPKTYLVHISGRKHTWVSLDYTITKLINDTDHLIVIANLPNIRNKKRHNYNEILYTYDPSVQQTNYAPTAVERSGSPEAFNKDEDDKVLNYFKENRHYADENFNFRSRSRSRSRLRYGNRPASSTSKSMTRNFSSESNPANGDIVWITGYSQNEIDTKLNDIFDYIMVLLPKGKKIKITIEIVINKTLRTLIDATNIYNPDFIVLSTLKWRRTDDLVKWKSTYINDKVATEFPVPVFLVPVKRLNDFEINLQNKHQMLAKQSKALNKQISVNANIIGTNDKSNVPGAIMYDNVNASGSSQASQTDASVDSGVSSPSINMVPRLQKKLSNLTIDFLKNKTEQKKLYEKVEGIDLSKYQLSKNDSLTTDIINSYNKHSDKVESDPEFESDFEDTEYESSDGDSADLKSFRSVISTTKEKLHNFAAVHRMIMLTNLSEVRIDRKLTDAEKKLKKIDVIMSTSLEFVMDLENFSDEEVDGHGEEFLELKTVLTGGAVRPTTTSKRSMLDVGTSNKLEKGRRSRRSSGSENTLDPSKIRFASNVKPNDGINVLGNTSRSDSVVASVHDSPALSPVSSNGLKQSKNDYRSHLNLPHHPQAMRVFSEFEKRNKAKKSNELRKVKSATQVNKVSSSSSSSSKKKKKKKFFFF
ncbi:hypothetical protein TPHA_0D02830 [Tetrapisispora phaffii CBS 4417]|uniref:Uncharacterized protein n=1 Tax=Tetrapisispora phaffii (strain ATCC 24235 / CBS 4417 / NBRC 1672 / NRRL Y-8282 / UCD 70-5) TaxID=1071381 RepID=G8BSU8_TETPH|nr:hypothetical protein TPHA_0D02830 [Tetrapisispora phaffii CBS 4417]CCE62919.1 hypothetical protein TPHA_0D02830 [Tetrapisispora phaffii CBS 4417]